MNEEEHSSNKNVVSCRNCEKAIKKEVKFCPSCGQKNANGKVRVFTYIAELFNLVFNIEGKLFTTLRDIFIPGKLTIEYFKGKRIRYFHPLRLFIVLAALLLAAITFSLKDELVNSDLLETTTITTATTIDIVQQIDSFNQQGLKKQLYDSIAYCSIENFKYNILGDYEDVPAGSNKINFNLGNNSINMKGSDMLRYSAEELIEKNNIKGFWAQLLFKQGVKFLNDTKAFGQYLISNSVWLVLLMMPFLALILKLFYLRHGKYYVEHLVFSLHTHSFIFLLFTLTVLLSYFLNIDAFIGILLLISVAYLCIALKKYYLQSWRLTLVKLFSISFCYSILASVFLLLGLVLGIVFF